MFTQCSQIIVDKLLKSEVRYCNPFPNARLSDFVNFNTKIGCHGKPLERSEKEGKILDLRSNSDTYPYHTVRS